jgi:hypothetical protein
LITDHKKTIIISSDNPDRSEIQKGEVRMEDMGMTNEQWYADIRNQIEDWEDVRELIQQTPDSPEKELALKKIDRTLRRLRENLEK